jgi:hypothetical protein
MPRNDESGRYLVFRLNGNIQNKIKNSARVQVLGKRKPTKVVNPWYLPSITRVIPVLSAWEMRICG